MSMEETRVEVNPEVQEETSEENLNELRKIRREKLKALQEAGRNPFLIEDWDVTAHSMDIKDNFDAMEDQEVSCAGRIMAFRNMGKASFIDIQDKQGRIQCYVRKDEIGEEEYKWFKTYDIGDIVGAEGEVFKTKTGEISVRTKYLNAAKICSYFGGGGHTFAAGCECSGTPFDIKVAMCKIIKQEMNS